MVFFHDGPGGPPYVTDLWRSDGTAAGTVMLKHDFQIYQAMEFKGKALILGGSASSGSGVWTSDGTPANTILVSASGASNGSMVLAGNQVFYQVYNGSNFNAIFRTAGTAAGSALVYVKALSANFGASPNLVALGDNVYFTAFSAAFATQLYRSDAAGNIVQITTLGGNANNTGVIAGLGTANGYVYFDGNDGVHGHELWRSNGTPGDQTMIADLNPNPNIPNSNPKGIVSIGGSLYSRPPTELTGSSSLGSTSRRQQSITASSSSMAPTLRKREAEMT